MRVIQGMYSNARSHMQVIGQYNEEFGVEVGCFGKARPINRRTITKVEVNSTMLNVEATFCNPGDMLFSGRGCDSAISDRCCMAQGKFRKLLPILTTRHLSPKMCSKVYMTCVRSDMLHSNTMWGPNTSELQWLRRIQCQDPVVCGFKDWNETPSAALECIFRLKFGPLTPLNCSGLDVMTVPWSSGSVVPKIEMKHPQLPYYRNLTLEILWQSFAVGSSDGMDMYSVLRPVLNVTDFLIGGTRSWRGLGVWRLMSVILTWLWLAHKTEMHAWKAGIWHNLVVVVVGNTGYFVSHLLIAK